MDYLKYYLKYVKTHLFYLLSLRNVVVIILINITCLIYAIISSSILNSFHLLDASRNEYFTYYTTNYFFFLKIIYIAFIIFINISFFNKDYASYSELFIKNSKTKEDFYITKYISIFIFYFIELLILEAFFYMMLIIVPYGKMYISFIKPFIRLYLYGVYYSLLSSLFLTLFNTYLSSIFVFILYFISFIINSDYQDNKVLLKIFNYVFPFGIDNTLVPFYGSISLILGIFLLTLLNSLVIILNNK